MENCELVRKMETIMAENEMLKNRNIELIKQVKSQQNWTGIREGVIIPKLRERYGEGDCVFSSLATTIGNIVKDYVGVSRFTEINEMNYEEAKKISEAVAETLCSFEWPRLEQLQKSWGKFK